MAVGKLHAKLNIFWRPKHVGLPVWLSDPAPAGLTHPVALVILTA
jgi:hypothetical protein